VVTYQRSGGVLGLVVVRGYALRLAWLQYLQAARQLISVNQAPPCLGGMMWSMSWAQPGQVGVWAQPGSWMRQ
jgi:hypothetical protein